MQTISLLKPLWSRVPDIEVIDEPEVIDNSELVGDAEPLPTIPEHVKLSTQQVDALLRIVADEEQLTSCHEEQ